MSPEGSGEQGMAHLQSASLLGGHDLISACSLGALYS